ncbi:MAG: heparinase II/III family protein, partial [Myxococcales bacterium]
MDRLEYYAYLASTVPAADLARAAARKVAQRANLALRKKAPLEHSELLHAFCAEDARDLAFKMAAPRASMLWADSGRRDEVLSVAGQVPGLVGRVLARADRAWAREFDVFGRKVCFGRGLGTIDWHKDALSGGRFDPAMDALAIGFGNEGLDPKAPWAVARFEQALALGQGVWISPSEEDRARYAHEFTTQVIHFARMNPVWTGVNWSCAMEVALRAANLCLGYLMMRHRPELQSPEFALTFATMLSAHGRYIEEHLEHTGAVSNNHYVANLVGLLHLGVIFPELPGARGWRERAARGLQEEIRRQVNDDGFSFEGSTAYHRLATELFTLALFIAHAGRIRLGDDYEQRLHDMYRAVRGYLTPGMKAPQIGDNDSGRALPLCDRGPLEHGYLLPLGAALFLDPELKPEGMPYCDEALFLMGPAGLERYRSLAESGPPRSSALARGGLYFVRSGETYCAISCGPNGQAGVGGHSHNDKLGIELHVGEHPVVVDTGTY